MLTSILVVLFIIIIITSDDVHIPTEVLVFSMIVDAILIGWGLYVLPRILDNACLS